MNQEFKQLLSRLETVTSRLEKIESGKSSFATVSHKPVEKTEAQPESQSIIAFNRILNEQLKKFVQNSVQVGSEVKSMAEMVKKVFELEKKFLIESTLSAAPSNDLLIKALQPLSKQIEEIQSFREKNRKSDYYNHLSGISESIGALGWLTVQPAPCPYIKDLIDAGQFYTNRVLKDFKEKDKDKIHFNWVQSWLQLLTELQAYVKQHHATGVSWNPKGSTLDPNKILADNCSAAPSVNKSMPPPPPPPVPSFDFSESESSSKPNVSDLHAKLAKELQIGTDITKNLKKVSDDQKTHKNTALRASSVVPGETKTALKDNSIKTPTNKPPKLELVDKKWIVEYQVGKSNLLIENTEIKQTVYIFQCKDCTIQVKGKVNSILLDSCTRVGLLFDDVLSTIEFINSKSVQAQVTGRVPTVSIDKSDGCQIYLSKNSLDTEIVSSKSSAMNVLIPSGTDGDFVEYPIPEQFKSVLKGNKFITTQTDTA